MTKAQGLASTIRLVQNKDPVRDLADLEERMNVRGLKACLGSANKLIDDLRVTIAEIDKGQAAMTPEVAVGSSTRSVS